MVYTDENELDGSGRERVCSRMKYYTGESVRMSFIHVYYVEFQMLLKFSIPSDYV